MLLWDYEEFCDEFWQGCVQWRINDGQNIKKTQNKARKTSILIDGQANGKAGILCPNRTCHAQIRLAIVLTATAFPISLPQN
jgi:hypothetical protein